MVSGEDDYTRELESDRKMPLWRAELSDGSVVVQDDGRPGANPPQAWLRLAEHLARTGLKIRKFWVQFRSNHLRDILPANAQAYFFSKSSLGQLNCEETLQFYLLGAVVDGNLTVQRWSIPELIHLENEQRDADMAGPCLIWN